jgi:hypothetical protein
LTLHDVRSSLREWTRRVWGAFGGRRTDHDLQRELAGHLALAEDELRRKGHAPRDAARLARAAAGGQSQAVEALREQRGLPWLGSSWLDVRLGLRLLVRNWGLTLVGGLATTLAIGIAAIVFAAFDVVMWSRLPLDEGDRVVAIQVWDREAGRRRDTTWQDVERWRATLHSVDDVGAFQTTRRNIITSDGSVELAAVAEISAAGFRVARVAPLVGRPIADADAAPGAAPVVVIGHDVWQRRFAGSRDVIGRELRLGGDVHTVVGVMPDGFQFPFNFRYWVPLRRTADGMLRNTGPEGVVFGRLAPGATLARAHAEVSALGILPLALGSAQREQGLALRSAEREGGKSEATGPRVVPYTFAFTGDFEPGDMSLLWSLSSLGLVLLLLPPCANIAILNYARTVSRQKEFAARYALGGSRARIIWQLFIEALVLTAAAAGVTLLVVQVVWVVVAGRLQNIPGGPPFWMTFGLSSRTLLFVAGLAVAGAAVSGLVPALQATGRLARLGAGALAGRTSVRLGATWTTLVIAQVAFSVGVLPLAAELAWGTLRTGVIGPGFAAEAFAPRVSRRKKNGSCSPRTRRHGRWPAGRKPRGDSAPCSLAIASASWRDGSWPTRASSAWRPPCSRPARSRGCSSTSRGATYRPKSTFSMAGRRDSSPDSTRSIPRSLTSIRCLPSPAADSPRGTLPQRPLRSSSTAISPRPSLQAATRSDAASGTFVRRAASGCTPRKRTAGTKSSVSSGICP